MKLHELLAVAGLALTGCSTRQHTPITPIEPAHISAPAPVAKVYKPVRNDVVEPLRDYIYAGYDSFMGKRRRDYPQLEERLVNALNATGLPKDTYEKIALGATSKELEQFFAEQGLLFRKVGMVGQVQFKANYELIKLGKEEQKERTVFGQTAKFTKITVIEPELILNHLMYRAQKQSALMPVVISLHWKGRNVVEFRALNAETLSKQYYGAEKKDGAMYDQEVQDHTLLDKHDNQQKLFDRMGTILHHVAVRDLYRAAKDEADFVSKLNAQWERNGEIRGAMNCLDDFNFDKSQVEKLTKENLMSLLMEQTVHGEMRALLAQMYEGNPHMYLGQILKLAGSQKAELGMNHFSAAQAVMIFGINVLADRKTYANIDLTGFEPGKETIIFKQFALLTEDQVRKLAKSAFDKIYEGKSFKEHMHDRLEFYINKQEDGKKKEDEKKKYF